MYINVDSFTHVNQSFENMNIRVATATTCLALHELFLQQLLSDGAVLCL
jgi:hypothetical protein